MYKTSAALISCEHIRWYSSAATNLGSNPEEGTPQFHTTSTVAEEKLPNFVPNQNKSPLPIKPTTQMSRRRTFKEPSTIPQSPFVAGGKTPHPNPGGTAGRKDE